MAANQGETSDISGETSGCQGKEMAEKSTLPTSRESEGKPCEKSAQVSDSSQTPEAERPMNDTNHATVIRQNYKDLVDQLQPQLFIHLLSPYIKDLIDDDLRTKKKSRTLLDILIRSPKEYFDEFCEVIAGLHPTIFELLKTRKPTKVEMEFYLKPFSDELREGIKCTGSKTDNEEDPRINLDTQFVSLKLTDISDCKDHPAQQQNYPHNLLNEGNIAPNYYLHNLQQRHAKDLDFKDILPVQSKGKNILVTGRAGVGKSTLVQFLNRQWAKKEWARTHAAVFLLNLRKLAYVQSKVNLSQLFGVYAEYTPYPIDPLQPTLHWLKHNEEKVLLFTDGIDELSDISRLFRDTPKLTIEMEGTPLEWCINLMRRNILQKSTLMMISRPFKGLKELKHDVKIDVHGLVPEKVMQFIELNIQPTRQTIVKETLHKNPVLMSVCSITFYCAKISRIIEEDERIDAEALTTYTRIMAFIISRLAARRAKEQEVDLVLSDELSKCLPDLAALAYRGLSESTNRITKLIFREEDFTITGFLREGIRHARETGLLVCRYVKDPLAEDMSETLEAEFVHLCIQELLAAAQMIKTNAQTVTSYLENVTQMGRLNMSQLFLFGLALDKKNKHIEGINQGVMTVAERKMHDVSKPEIERSLVRHLEFLCSKMILNTDEMFVILQSVYESQSPDLAKLFGARLAPGGSLILGSLHLTAVDMKALFFVLQCSPIQQLIFRNITMDNASASEIQKQLSRCGQIRFLCLENTDLTDEAMKYVSEAVKSTKTLTALGFANKKATTESMKYLSDSINTNTSIKTLHLFKDIFTVEDIELFCPAIKRNLRHLQLHSDRILPEAMLPLSNAIGASTALIILQLIIKQISSEGMKHLAEAVQRSSGLSTLHLANHLITPKAMKKLASAITISKSLTALVLENNQIATSSMKDLLKAVGRSATLTRIQFEKLQLTDEVMELLSEVIKATTWLKKLTLKENQITDNGLKSLSSALSSTSGLTDLVYMDNQISTEGMKHLSAALKSTTSVQHVALADDHITDKGMEYLQDAIVTTRSLKSLQVFGNKNTQKWVDFISQAISRGSRDIRIVVQNVNSPSEGVVQQSVVDELVKEMSCFELIFVEN